MKKIKITNFRKIKETWELELAPVTFLVGTNNSGKSSVLKSLMILDDFANTNDHFTLKFNGEHSNNHKIDCFHNAINRYNLEEKNYYINFSFIDNQFLIEYSFFPNDYSGDKFEKGKLKSLKFQFINDASSLLIYHVSGNEYQIEIDTNFYNKSKDNDDINETKKEYESTLNYILKIIEEKTLQLNSQNLSLKEQLALRKEIKDEKKKIKLIKNKINQFENRLSSENQILQPKINLNDFDSIRTIEKVLLRALSFYVNKQNNNKDGYINEKTEMQKIANMLQIITNSLKINISHLTPNRNTQTRLYINNENTNDIHHIIKEFYDYPILNNSEADKFLKNWMLKFDIGEDYRIIPIQGLATIIEIKEAVESTKTRKKIDNWINLVDKGFGAGQIFSILLKIATSINKIENYKNQVSKRKTKGIGKTENPILLIEEPEANLHPFFQSKLTELFFSTSQKYGIQFIIETHSEYIIRNSQVIHNSLKSQLNGMDFEPMRVYYFGKDALPYDMKYRNDGRFVNEFGPGFFDVNTNLIFDLL